MKLRVNVRFEGTELVPLREHLVPRVWLLDQHEESGEWPALRVRVEVRDGAPQIRRVEVESTVDGMEVQTAHLRNIPLEELVEYMAGVVAQEVTLWEDLPDGVSELTVDDVSRARAEGKQGARDARRARRRTVTTSFLEEVARVYLASDEAPVRAVEEHFGKTRRTASWYVKQAREQLPELFDDARSE